VVGPAAERVVHSSLLRAAPQAGYRLENPTRGTAGTILGGPVPIGPLDKCGFAALRGRGPARAVVALPIEVKNLRDWLYPANAEVYQLLAKAALLQCDHRDVPIMPLLIARRMHVTTFRMFKDLGAYAIQTKRQYVGAVEGGGERFQEVRVGLGLLDMIQLPGDDDLITGRLIRVVPRDAQRVSEDWAETCTDSTVVDLFQRVRQESRITARTSLVNQLRDRIDELGRYSGGW
jgi:hypothetical protein